MKHALVITVGNTPDPIVDAIANATSPVADLVVYLLYGRPFDGQAPSPLDVVRSANEKAAEIGLVCYPREVSDPEDINKCLELARQIFRDIADADIVTVNFTGGTKPLSASVVHAALTAGLAGQLIMDYTGGQQRDSNGRVLRDYMKIVSSERTATDELVRRVLDLLRSYEYLQARALSGQLPEKGRAGFVRQAGKALCLWDSFHYAEAVEVMRRIRGGAEAFSDDQDLGAVSRLILRLCTSGDKIVPLIKALQQPSDNRSLFGKDPGTTGVWLVADALENSARRLAQQEATESVLRSYRAVEVSVQMALLQRKVNPWKLDWDAIGSQVVQEYQRLARSNRLPTKLGLNDGVYCLCALGIQISDDLAKRLQDLQRVRNSSYLEHGYQKVDMDSAGRLFDVAVQICELISGQSLSDARRDTCHIWG